MADRMEVVVVTPDREVWSGESTLVVARGTEGEVGVQRGHAPMLIRLAPSVLRIQLAQGWQRAAVDGGFLHVVSGQEVTRVDVLADGATLEQDVDRAAAEEARRDAQARVDAGDESALRDLARAEALLNLTGEL